MTDTLRKYVEQISKKRGGLDALIKAVEAMPKANKTNSLEGFEGGEQETKIKLAKEGGQQLEMGRALSSGQQAGLEAIIDEHLRPAFLVKGGTFTANHPLWLHLNDAAYKQRIEKAIRSIGRIELPNDRLQRPYGGTGFIVGKDLIMTNRHVAEAFAAGIGDRHIRFIDGAQAGIDFLREEGQPTGPMLRVRGVTMIHPYWDMALLKVEGLGDREALSLSARDARDLNGQDVFIVGYPGFDSRNPADVQNKLFERTFGVKRMQPGELQGGEKTESFGKLVSAATHDISTLGGNSGSAVIDLDTGEVLALHFGGRYHESNFAVPAGCLAQDSRVINAGVQFAGSSGAGPHSWGAWWDRADQQEAPSGSDDSQDSWGAGKITVPQNGGAVRTLVSGNGEIRVQVPLTITVSLGQPTPAGHVAVTEATVDEDALEAVRQPPRDTNYSTRRGYDPNFLNQSGEEEMAPAIGVPMPKAADPGVLASTKRGDQILAYQNFSIAMHAKRRLALFTAANVTDEPKLREPDPSKEYTRKALMGQEKWYLDDRLDHDFQIPEVFFTKDRGAFDKGHITRRDDVAWGRTYEELRRANGDSYHVTNCSPQTSEYNQSSKGKDNWGDLENHVLSEAASERLCVFAGPVFADSDEIFVGKGQGGVTLRAKIPARFWKVIVARVAGGIAVYGFVLEQDLSEVDFREFTVPPEFLPAMYSIPDIENMTGIIFDPVIRSADQYETIKGTEVSWRSGAKKRKKKNT